MLVWSLADEEVCILHTEAYGVALVADESVAKWSQSLEVEFGRSWHVRDCKCQMRNRHIVDYGARLQQGSIQDELLNRYLEQCRSDSCGCTKRSIFERSTVSDRQDKSVPLLSPRCGEEGDGGKLTRLCGDYLGVWHHLDGRVSHWWASCGPS